MLKRDTQLSPTLSEDLLVEPSSAFSSVLLPRSHVLDCEVFDRDDARLPRETLYIADELFFTGTAAEVTPIRSVDGVVIGEWRVESAWAESFVAGDLSDEAYLRRVLDTLTVEAAPDGG